MDGKQRIREGSGLAKWSLKTGLVGVLQARQNQGHAVRSTILVS